MTSRDSIVVLVDGDNTLLDNDLLQDGLRCHLAREFGVEWRDRYWKILVDLFTELGYRDYLGALQRLRVEHPRNQQLLAVSGFFMDYPFADRLYAGALDVLRRLGRWGRTVILADGDVVFQPRKVERSGIAQAVGSHVLIYIHKEEALDDVKQRYPAQHYVLVDDKPRILTAAKAFWCSRVTTILPRQGQFALNHKVLPALPAPYIVIERIGDLLGYDLPGLMPGSPQFTSRLEAAK